MAKQIKIDIPKPCHENWDGMNPTEQGAFCQNCKKEVIDFSARTENEIYDILKASTGRICGRFREEQLNAPITKSEINTSLFNWKAIAASVAAFVTAGRSFGGTSDLATKTILSSADTHAISQPANPKYAMPGIIPYKDIAEDTAAAKEITVKGKAVDSLTGKPLRNALVTFSDEYGNYNKHEVRTNARGRFILKCLFNKGSIHVNCAGHMGKTLLMKEVSDAVKHKRRILKIALLPTPRSRMIKGDIASL
ncbi:MAG: hypothetical protein JWO06_57 [Bacteroidota bacterium]|nr:hypothetical protein [Bacteroidota bacterium]